MNDRNHHHEGEGEHGEELCRHDEERRDDARRRESLSVSQVIASTFAAIIGVQSSRNRERDFTRGKPSHFIAAGIVVTVLFVLTLVLVVNLVLSG